MTAPSGNSSALPLSMSEWRTAQRCLLAHVGRLGIPDDLEAPSETVWPEIVSQAFEHRIAGLAYRCLTAPRAATPLPPAIARELREAHSLIALRNALIFHHATEVVAALAGMGIPTLFLKGLHLARSVYAELGLRSMADIDLMVPRSQLEQAERVLLDLGYGMRPRLDVAAQAARLHHLARLEKPNAVTVELHHAIEVPTSPFPIDREALWQNIQPIALNGTTAYGLADAHLLIHLCLHLAYHHGFRRSPLKALIDVTTLLEQRGDAFPWDEVVASSRAWGTDAFVYTTLRLASHILGASVPRDVLARMAHNGQDGLIVETAARLITAPPLDRHLTGSGQVGRGPLRFLVRGVWPPREQLRREYGQPQGEAAVRLYARRTRDVWHRRRRVLMRVALGHGSMRRVISHLCDAGQIASWVEGCAPTGGAS